MKIVLVTNNYKPYSGGVVSAIDTLVQSLVQLGNQVSIITLDFEGQGSNYVLPVPVIRLACPVRFKYKTNYVAIPWQPDQAILALVASLKPDIIHASHPFLLGVSALKAGQKLKIPVVFTYHSQYEKFAHLVPIPEIISTCLIAKRLLAFCTQVSGIIAPSKTIANNITQDLSAKNNHDINKNLSNIPIQVIPSAISPLYLDTSFSIKPFNPVFKLLTVSRFAKEKNLGFLLEMFKQLVTKHSNFSLTLVGYGPELASLKYQAYQALGLGLEQVIFIERPEKNQIKQLYQQSDLFVFASQSETQGLVLAEAMACGTPVVALAGPGQNDLIVNGQNGFLVDNLAQMVAAILSVSSNLALHQNLQQNAFWAAKNYDPMRLGQKQLDFYEHLIKTQQL